MTAPSQRVRAAWKMLTGTGAAASAGLGVLVFACVLVAVAAPRQSLDLQTRALRHSFAASPALTRSVVGTISYNDFDLSLDNAPLAATDLADAGRQLASNLAAQHIPLAPHALDWSVLSTAYTPVPAAARSAYEGDQPPQVEVLYRDALASNSRLIAGTLPVRAQTQGHGVDFQIAVTRATAARFSLKVGSRLLFAPSVRMTVSGIIAPTTPRSTFWGADPSAATPVVQMLFDRPPYLVASMFVGGAELPALQRWFNVAKMQLNWYFPLTLGNIDAAQAVTLGGSLTGAETSAGEVFAGPQGIQASVTLASGLSGVVAQFISEDNAIASLMGLLAVSLVVIGAVVILLAGRLLADYRSGEFAVMRARGASRRQVATLALRAGAVVSVPAAVAGAALAVALTPGFNAPLSWWLAGLTVLIALAGPTVIAARSRVVGGAGRRPDRVTGRHAAVRRVVAEVTLAAAAIGGLIVLRRQGAQAGGSDVYTSAVPVLVAIPAAIVVMRCYPVAVRLLLRLAGVRPGVTAFVGLARAARTSVSALLPAFALVLTLAVVAFGAMVNAAVYRGQVAASWQRVGADAVVNGSDSPKPYTPAVQRKIAAVPGVTRTAGVLVTSGTTTSGQPLGIVALDPAQYAALVAATPLPAFPARTLARPAAAGAEVPVLASRLAVALIGKGSTTLSSGVTKLKIRYAGFAPAIPSVSGGAFVVVPSWALGATPPPPSMLLVVGPHLDEQKLAATATRAALGSFFTFRSHVLAGLTGAPLPHGADTAFAQVAVAASGFSLLILLITLVLSARSREFTVARLRVMGLSQRQARWLVAVETLPQVLAAMIGGVAAAWTLALLVGPAISLAAFTGTGTGVPVRVEPVPMIAAAVGLVVLALLALAAQLVIADRRGATRVLRIAE
jgi:putative ABC transport system permease protein